ncbi:AzlD domain-containing protein [Ktedonospora formicarum]|uniref:Uncharacterized protein n=1 Tax=Ktedonospora formicarum TaxID=2778364 RepID=A0A8J3HZS1_9CHLR|nr:AzlD domain-containing protein [Ktedonospora formicarum]GHO46176.1 hypothetical protein KSX_43390 [Ktedonospora formicarum]
MMIWLLIACIGLATFAVRISFVLGLGKVEVSPLVLRILRLVPIAVLTAIILPQLVLPTGSIDFSTGNPRWIAGILAALIAWWTRNVFLTIAAGMVALWLLQWLL